LRTLITKCLLESEGIGWGSSTTELEAKAAAKLLRELGIEKAIAFDVGANIGNWSKAFVRFSHGATSYAFEPSAVTFQQLRNNTSENPNILPINLGMSSQEGKATLFTNEPGSGFASLVSRRLNHFDIAMNEHEEVNLSTIDAFVARQHVFPSVIKLDIEGYELAALLGADNSLSRVPLIQFEFGGCNLDTHTTFQDFWYFFIERNFKMYRLGPRGLIKIKKYSEMQEIYITTNFYAVNGNYNPDSFA
jgi:FkbM family methyltransferase